MTIHGIKITDAQIQACEKRMMWAEFHARNIDNCAQNNGVPRIHCYDFIAPRLADRLIQHHRNLGNIKYNTKTRLWSWVAVNQSKGSGM